LENTTGENGDNERLKAADNCGHTAGEPVRSNKEQRKECSDVENAENPGLPPPFTARPPSAEHQEQDSRRKRTHSCREQWPILRRNNVVVR